jgi:threonine synthase
LKKGGKMVEELKCRECGKTFSAQPLSICENCFGPLEVIYDYAQIATKLTRETIHTRGKNMWRYRELLPGNSIPASGACVGLTPLIRARNLAKHWGVQELYIKNDAVNFPTLSFKDRVVSVALAKAIEFGFTVVGCASTGNLANALAAQAAASGLQTCILIPSDLESAKITGTLVYGANLIAVNGNYDEVNRLCTQIADRYQWGFVNVNLRAYYAEGSKTVGYEILEQLGWKTPQHIVVPMAGGSLITKIHKAVQEFQHLGLVEDSPCRIYGAQAEGCAPIVNMVKQGQDRLRPVKPHTIAKSLAIGNPADGIYAARVMRQSGGTGESATDQEIVDGIRLLARTEGIFAETAGGVVVAATEKLIRSGKLPSNESIVLCITGNGLKTQEAIAGVQVAATIKPTFQDFQNTYEQGGASWQLPF